MKTSSFPVVCLLLIFHCALVVMIHVDYLELICIPSVSGLFEVFVTVPNLGTNFGTSICGGAVTNFAMKGKDVFTSVQITARVSTTISLMAFIFFCFAGRLGHVSISVGGFCSSKSSDGLSFGPSNSWVILLIL